MDKLKLFCLFSFIIMVICILVLNDVIPHNESGYKAANIFGIFSGIIFWFSAMVILLDANIKQKEELKKLTNN